MSGSSGRRTSERQIQRERERERDRDLTTPPRPSASSITTSLMSPSSSSSATLRHLLSSPSVATRIPIHSPSSSSSSRTAEKNGAPPPMDPRLSLLLSDPSPEILAPECTPIELTMDSIFQSRLEEWRELADQLDEDAWTFRK